jgi:hypothetical protein
MVTERDVPAGTSRLLHALHHSFGRRKQRAPSTGRTTIAYVGTLVLPGR